MSDEGTIPGGGRVADVPLELRERKQWVGWRTEIRDGKPTRVPVNVATGGLASSTDPESWCNFGPALAWANGAKGGGVGFVFTADDPYVGIDFDDVVDPTTGEADADALAEADALHSYTEYSPSGMGLHVILRGKLKRPGRKRGDRECYETGRFFTITGQIVHGLGIEDRQAELDTWHNATFPEKRPTCYPPSALRQSLGVPDGYLRDKIRDSKQGEKFSDLFDRGETAGYASGSEADLALCSILTWWTNHDMAAVDRFFRASALMRPKWDAKRSDSTYGGRTLNLADVTTDGGYIPDPPVELRKSEPPTSTSESDPDRLFRWASELTGPQRAEEWLWEGYLPRGGITLFSALWKSGKTTLLSHLLTAFATGGTFLGKPIRQCKVLYVSEEGERLWVKRRDKIGIGDNVGFYVQPFAMRPNTEGWKAFIDQIVKDCQTYGFDLVIFDTLAKLWPVREENSATDVDNALLPLQGINQVGAAVLLIHHMRKSGGQEYTGSRGSGALSAFPDIIVEMVRNNASDTKDKRRILKAKGRYEETPEELVIEWTGAAYVAVDGPPELPASAITPDEDAKAVRDWVMEVLTISKTPWLTSEGIREGLRAHGHSVRDERARDAVSSLYESGLLVMRGKMRSTTDPRCFALKTRVHGSVPDNPPPESREGRTETGEDQAA